MGICNSLSAKKQELLAARKIKTTLSQDEYNKLFGIGANEVIIKYFDEAMSKALLGTFQLKQAEKGHWWYGEWENHRRMVISLFAAKGLTYTIEWGYNYDFIPKLNRQDKFVWSRTEKSFDHHAWDNYYFHVKEDMKSMSEQERVQTYNKYTLPTYTSNLESALAYIDGVIKRNIPFMTEWFDRVQTTDDVIAELDRHLGTNDYRDHYRHWTKAFLLARQNRLDEAIAAMQNNYPNREIAQKVLDKLQKAGLED